MKDASVLVSTLCQEVLICFERTLTFLACSKDANLSVALSFVYSRWPAPSRWNRQTARAVEVVVFFSSSFFISLFFSPSYLSGIISLFPFWPHPFRCSVCNISLNQYCFFLSQTFLSLMLFINASNSILNDKSNCVCMYTKQIMWHQTQADLMASLFQSIFVIFLCLFVSGSNPFELRINLL